MRLLCCTCRKRTYSLPILMYANPALHVNDKQSSELNACWNSVIRKRFGYHKWESVSAVLLGLGRLNFKHLVMLHKVKFCWHLYCSTDVFLCDMFLADRTNGRTYATVLRLSVVVCL